MHEAGHALGIREAKGIREANDGIEQILHHPTIKDAVMGAIDDPGYACSPHPFDIYGHLRAVSDGGLSNGL